MFVNRELYQNGRIIASIRGRYDPYCIFRLVEIVGPAENRSCRVWLSLKKKDVMLKPGDVETVWLGSSQVTVECADIQFNRARLIVSCSDDIVEIRPLFARPTKPE